MRPASETHLALLQAAHAIHTERAETGQGATLLELVHRSQVGYKVARALVAKLKCRGQLPKVNGEGFAEYMKEVGKFGKAVRAITGGKDPDIVFEHPGRSTMGASVFITKRAGTIVTCAATSGYMIEYDNRHLWTFIEAGDEEETFSPPPAQASDEASGLPPRYYPEWDEITGDFRPDWCAVYEALHPAGNPADIDRLLETLVFAAEGQGGVAAGRHVAAVGGHGQATSVHCSSATSVPGAPRPAPPPSSSSTAPRSTPRAAARSPTRASSGRRTAPSCSR